MCDSDHARATRKESRRHGVARRVTSRSGGHALSPIRLGGAGSARVAVKISHCFGIQADTSKQWCQHSSSRPGLMLPRQRHAWMPWPHTLDYPSAGPRTVSWGHTLVASS
jgi:hypothetical protein